MRVGSGRVPPVCDMKLVSCGTMKVMKMVIERRAGEGEEGRINQRLLHAVAEIFLLHQVLDHARQNIGQRAARFAGADHVHIERRERCAGNRASACEKLRPSISDWCSALVIC